MKAYFFYLNDRLYAYTDNKEHRKAFESQRRIQNFEIRTLKLSKEKFDEFDDINYKQKLITIVIHDGYNYLNLIGTQHEENELNFFIDELEGKFRDIMMFFYEFPIKNKHKKVIDELSNTVEMIPREDAVGGGFDQYMNINQLRVFYTLFKETFSP